MQTIPFPYAGTTLERRLALPRDATTPWDGAQAMPARRSPAGGDSSDAILASLDYDEAAISDLKVQGVVF
jgi:crotonobetainyl-CoA:carnitine CoA-transferase CaiB-like acyl-CoA transferase